MQRDSAVLLLDGYNLLFRAFTSLPRSIVGKDGKPVNAVYGLVGAIIRLARELSASYALLALDVPDVPNFRSQLYPPYQMQRGPLGGEHADDFARQVRLAPKIVEVMGITSVQKAAFEADDVIATMAVRVAAEGGSALAVSTDRDLLQIVAPRVEVVVPSNPLERIRTPEQVRARIGVEPGMLADYKALAGDASDNYPGVKGIGSKTAASLINRWGKLEHVYAHLNELPARTKRLLEEEHDQAFLFRQIATVVYDVDIAVQPEELGPLLIAQDARPRGILDAAGFG